VDAWIESPRRCAATPFFKVGNSMRGRRLPPWEKGVAAQRRGDLEEQHREQ
jgi:hypothetical protein